MHIEDTNHAKAIASLTQRTREEQLSDREHLTGLHSTLRAEARAMGRRARRRSVISRAGGVLVVAIALFVGVRTRVQPAGAAMHDITFSLDDAGAQRVAVVGEFNGWNRDATPMTRTDDGRWRARVAVSPGRYTYSFVVNDSVWVADPSAPRAPNRWFGGTKSVLVVASLP